MAYKVGYGSDSYMELAAMASVKKTLPILPLLIVALSVSSNTQADCPFFNPPTVEECGPSTNPLDYNYPSGMSVCHGGSAYRCIGTTWARIDRCEVYRNKHPETRKSASYENDIPCRKYKTQVDVIGPDWDSEFDLDEAVPTINSTEDLTLSPRDDVLLDQMEVERRLRMKRDEAARLEYERVRIRQEQEKLRAEQAKQNQPSLDDLWKALGEQAIRTGVDLAIEESVGGDDSESYPLGGQAGSCQNAAQQIAELQQQRLKLQRARQSWGTAVHGSIIQDTKILEKQIDQGINSIKAQCY